MREAISIHRSETPFQPMNTRPATEDREKAPWRPFVDGLRSFIAQRVPPAHAEDVLQDTLLRLHEATSSLRDASRAEAWVFSIARRTIADFYRKEERRPPETPIGSPKDVASGRKEAAASTEQLAEYEGAHGVHEEVLSWLRPMAEELPRPDRRALVMADFEGHTQQEVADELGLSLSGAKSRVQRARVKLGERLERCCEIEFGPSGQAEAFRRRGAEE